MAFLCVLSRLIEQPNYAPTRWSGQGVFAAPRGGNAATWRSGPTPCYRSKQEKPASVNRDSLMTDYLYDSHGNPVGFWRGRYVYVLNGTPVGQLNGTHVHKLAGGYVGELDHDMVVDKHMGDYGNIGHPGHPGNPGHPGHPGNRGAMNYGYPDVFQKLLE